MKVILCALLLFLSFFQTTAQTLKSAKSMRVTAKINRQVELLSIVARLADYDEYLQNSFKSYAADVDTYFAKYKHHPAIEFAREIRESNGVGFDAVASMAVHLNSNLTPKVSFSDSIPDKRWSKQKAEKFVKLLQQFYRDAGCETFFKSHSELYKLAEERAQSVVDKVDFTWYQDFYGEIPKGNFNLYISLLNGGMNFGPKVVYPDGREELFAVIGTRQTDEKDLPVYTDNFLPTIIHEFNHSFINNLIYAHERSLQPSGEKIFQPVSAQMAKLAYGSWKVTLIESLVRAAVARYLYDHQEFDNASKELIIQRNLGFLWIEDLFVLFGAYENSRKSYPTFRSFFPLVEGYTADLAKRIETKAKVFQESVPKVTAIDNFPNGAQDVDSKLTEITLTFDRPLAGKGYSFNQGSNGEDHYPIDKVIGYNNDRTKFTIQVKLKPAWEYEFIVTGKAFATPDGYPLQNYTVKFKTKKE